MSAPELVPVAIPSNDVPTQHDRSDPTCGVCGKPLTYSGRGRPPTRCDDCKPNNVKPRAASPRATAGVDQAVASIDALYALLSMGLMAIGAQSAASTLAMKKSTLNVSNAEFLARDPALVKLINRGGASTGRVGFFATNLVVLVPIGMAAFAELTEKTSE